MDIIELKATDLAAMLCSRVCHDLINPIGAIGNGLEVLADPNQGEMAEGARIRAWRGSAGRRWR